MDDGVDRVAVEGGSRREGWSGDGATLCGVEFVFFCPHHETRIPDIVINKEN